MKTPYDYLIKQLGLKSAKPSRKKFIIIQIDSLPYSLLQKYIDNGGCKFLARLIEKEGYNLQKYNCGLPSGTPAVQAGIMYGKNKMIPAYRFLDKKARRNFSFGSPGDVKYLEEKYFKNEGILKGGSSYCNHWSGGAEQAILTMSSITKKKRLRRVKESSLWLFLFLHPLSLGRVMYYTMAELVISAFEVLTLPIMQMYKKRHLFSFWIPLRRVFMNALMAELTTAGVLLDIRRKMPKIYINYLTFDTVAHMRGPDSTVAYLAVRAIERRIKRIYRRAEDKYDIYIISDHGQVASIPFSKENGMTLTEYIEKCTKIRSFGISAPLEGRTSIFYSMASKTFDFLNYLSAPVRWIGKTLTKGYLKAFKPEHYKILWEDNRIFVCESCAMANVYFSTTRERMDIKEIEKEYPRLIEKLIGNKAVGMMMVRSNDKTLVVGKEGKLTISKDGIIKEGKEFWKEYGAEEDIFHQLKEFSSHDNLGDLVLFGNYKEGVGYSFAEHVGSHAGLGGDMSWPFFISKQKVDLSKVKNARELHSLFKVYQ